MKTNLLFISTLFLAANGYAALANSGQEDEPQKKERPVQVTFITPLGTNGIDAPKIENKLSLNLLTGVNGGVDGVEAGGLVNVIAGEMNGVQVGGLGNYVHGSASGVQFGGLFNSSRSISGSQLAGLTNIALNDGKGAQVAGALNVNTGSFEGFQAAGLLNYAGGDVTAGQAAGLVNIGLKNTSNAQLAGLLNVSGASHKGSQIAGLVNVGAGDVSGSQIAGILNYGKKVKGVQIGLINVADSVGGAQVGLFSYARNGQVTIGVATDETFQGRLFVKSGLRSLYGIYAIGAHDGPTRYWAAGWGLGSSLLQGRKTGLNIEGSVFHINEDEWWTDELNMLVRLNLNLRYHASPRLALAAGVSGNLAISQMKDSEGRLTGGAFVPDRTFYDHTGKNTKTSIYPGFNAGIEWRIK